jgi:photosystem II stability/assembly factor-like uncharacterized protein
MKRMAWFLAIVLTVCGIAHAQWQIQNSGTTADLRGIDNVGGGVAWASGTSGTVLRTEDGGYLWQACAIPPGAEHLDFRGVQAFDANTAIVMSSGKGDLSRLYKTTDGCQTWKLVFTNPDKDGFWDAIQFDGNLDGMLLGDPVGGQFAVFISKDGGQNWIRQESAGMKADASQESIFAASNSSLVMFAALAHRFFVTGGLGGALFIECHGELEAGGRPERVECLRNPKPLPLAKGASSSGAFSLGFAPNILVTVGGDYLKPNDRTGTAAIDRNVGSDWHAAQTPPHGYRSAVAYDAATKTWITVGPNGTDISTDDGRNWRALHPDPAFHEAPDADRNWNALSLPFVVGPHGRIGKLNPRALAK